MTKPRILKCKDLEQMPRDNIIAALEYTHWKIYGPKGAAEILGINPSTLAARMRSFGIKRDRN
jgi:transcriptional regulator with GAF, ATPase, and Fis domain